MATQIDLNADHELSAITTMHSRVFSQTEAPARLGPLDTVTKSAANHTPTHLHCDNAGPIRHTDNSRELDLRSIES
jgi:hypothetical protein